MKYFLWVLFSMCTLKAMEMERTLFPLESVELTLNERVSGGSIALAYSSLRPNRITAVYEERKDLYAHNEIVAHYSLVTRIEKNIASRSKTVERFDHDIVPSAKTPEEEKKVEDILEQKIKSFEKALVAMKYIEKPERKKKKAHRLDKESL